MTTIYSEMCGSYDGEFQDPAHVVLRHLIGPLDAHTMLTINGPDALRVMTDGAEGRFPAVLGEVAAAAQPAEGPHPFPFDVEPGVRVVLDGDGRLASATYVDLRTPAHVSTSPSWHLNHGLSTMGRRSHHDYSWRAYTVDLSYEQAKAGYHPFGNSNQQPSDAAPSALNG